jgi:23S rRNA (adenine2030-N6)-methyltransferase
MLAYRHAFHVGNHADALKHLVLLSCLEYLTRKETPVLYLDTHAGAGSYRLDSGYSTKNKEWLTGWQKLKESTVTEEALALNRYLQSIQKFQEFEADVALYPGSPVLARRLLRDQDHGVLCEIHPTDYDILSNLFEGDPWIQVRKEDGFHNLKAVLPPPARRALVLIDPPYEMVHDYSRLPKALEASLKRFATGCYLVWYPMINRPEAKNLPLRLEMIAQQANRSWLRTELLVRQPEAGQLGMWGSGMFIINPPYVLKEEIEGSLPLMQNILAPEDGSWSVVVSEEKTNT